MALIGFIVLLGAGISMVVIGIVAASVVSTFSGRIEWPPVIFFCGGGGALIYLAVKYSPIAITWSAA